MCGGLGGESVGSWLGIIATEQPVHNKFQSPAHGRYEISQNTSLRHILGIEVVECGKCEE